MSERLHSALIVLAAISGLLFTLAVTSSVIAQTPRTVEILATDFAFEPNRINVERGETVRLKLVNAGSLSHNVHLSGASLKTETVQGGGTDSVTFTAQTNGTVSFFCNVPGHRQAGMQGEIVIEQ